MKKIISVLICFALCFGISGCKNNKKDDVSPANAPAEQKQTQKIKIYVGRGEDFKEYEEETDSVTVKNILEKTAEKTGWNLEINGEPKEENGSIKIDFSKKSSVGSGKVNETKEEFKARSRDELVCMILDSVTKTVLKNFSDAKNVVYTCGGEEITLNGKNASEFDYKIGDYEKYSEDDVLEFLKNHLSDYYDTPTTKYEKYGEEFKDGKRLYIYRAVDKNTNELLGTYKVSSDLWYLYETADNKDELIWSMDSYM